MPYIGRNTDKLSNVEVLDNITFDGSQSYTLQKNSVNFTPSSANTILISIDGVVQAGNFTVSGSTIDFGVAVASSSTCDFILHYGVGLITTPADGTVSTAKLASDAVTNTKLASSIINSQTAETSIAGGDEVLIYDTSASALRKMTRTNFVSGVGGVNTPAFRAKVNSNQTISNVTNTAITFDTEEFDVGSNYDTSNGRFTPTTSGKYFLYVKLKVALGTGIVYVEFRKNGSGVHSNYLNVGSRPSGDYGLQLSTIQSANGSSDYFDINYYQGSGSSKTLYGGADSSFMGYKIIE